MNSRRTGAFLAAGLAACGGSSSTGTDGGATDAGTRLQPTLSSIQTNIFTNTGCTAAACHAPPTLAGNMDLRPGHSYATLLGANGQGAPIPDMNASDTGEAQGKADGYLLVTPGNPDKSFLYLKVKPGLDPKYGAPMPNPNSGLPALTAEQVTAIHDWIAAGAQNN